MKKKIKLGIVGCGAIGQGTASFLDKHLSRELVLGFIYDKDIRQAEALKQKLHNFRPRIVDSLEDLVKNSDLILETASWKIIDTLMKKALQYKKDLIILSIGGLINKKHLLNKAKKRGITIYLPSGAICGVDGILASYQGKIKKCILSTSKPPQGFKDVAYFQKRKINLAKIKKETIVFQGSPQKAFKYFPKNINVASTLLLASDFKNTKVYVKINPKIKRNIHEIYLESEVGKITIKVENTPSKDNPKTSTLAIASAQALIKKLTSKVKIGT